MKNYFILFFFVSFYSFAQKGDFTNYKADALYEEEYQNGKPSGISNMIGKDISFIKDNALNTLTLFITDKQRHLNINFFLITKTKDGEIIQADPTSQFNQNGTYFTSFPGYHKYVQKSNALYVFYINDNQIKWKYTFSNLRLATEKEMPKLK